MGLGYGPIDANTTNTQDTSYKDKLITNKNTSKVYHLMDSNLTIEDLFDTFQINITYKQPLTPRYFYEVSFTTDSNDYKWDTLLSSIDNLDNM